MKNYTIGAKAGAGVLNNLTIPVGVKNAMIFAREDIFLLLNLYAPTPARIKRGDYFIREVFILDNAAVWRKEGEDDIFLCTKVRLGPVRELNAALIDELIDEGANAEHLKAIGKKDVCSELMAMDLNVEKLSRQFYLQIIKDGDVETLKTLVDSGFKAAQFGYEGVTLAAEYGRIKILQQLVRAGANLQKVGYEAVKAAVKKGHTQTVRYLLSQNCIAKEKRGYALNFAARYGCKILVQYLLDNGVNPLDNERTALKAAVDAGHMHIAAMMLGRDEGSAKAIEQLLVNQIAS